MHYIHFMFSLPFRSYLVTEVQLEKELRDLCSRQINLSATVSLCSHTPLWHTDIIQELLWGETAARNSEGDSHLAKRAEKFKLLGPGSINTSTYFSTYTQK